MCGRFYIDNNITAEIKEMMQNEEISIESHTDVFPSNTALVLKGLNGRIVSDHLIFGFRHFDPAKKSLIINARAETVLGRKMFKDSVTSRRCVIPTSGFYEWDKDKTKIAFMHQSAPVLYLAGFWKDDRFVILTTAPNASISDVHNRMPLTLEKEEIANWLFDPDAYKIILNKVPAALNRKI